MKKIGVLSLILCVVMGFVLGGCSTGTTGGNSTTGRTVTDEGGNTVELPQSIEKVAITPIPWASAMWAIDGSSERIVSINPSAMTQYKKSFMASLDSGFAAISTKEITQDFTINIEELLKLEPNVAFIWNDQTEEAEQLKAVGITPVMLNYAENLEDLKSDITLMGQVLGQEERAKTFTDYQDKTNAYLETKSQDLEGSVKPKVLYLQNKKLSVAGAKNINNTLLKMTGGENVAAGIEKKWAEVNMEQILSWNPEIIYLSNFDETTPEDLYENRIEGQDWSNIDAVKNHRVYKTPVGLLRWDAPCVETPLMQRWMAKIQQPDIFSDLDVKSDIADFYKKNLDTSLTEGDLNTILNNTQNGSIIQ